MPFSRDRAVLFLGSYVPSSRGSRAISLDVADQLAAAGWDIVRSSFRSGRFARLTDMLQEVACERQTYCLAQVDVFSGKAFAWSEIVCWMLRRMGKPYVLTLHGGNLPQFSLRWGGRVRRHLRAAAVVTTPSRYLWERMQPYRADLRLVPNGINVGQHDFRLRRNPHPRMVWLRAFHEIYRPWMALEVLARLLDRFPDSTLVMAGPDKGDGSLDRTRNAARALGVADRVSWRGWVPKEKVPAFLQEGDIFLNTSAMDNTPVVVLEAMASGLCVVSTEVGGMPYILQNGCDALLAPDGDVEAMASAVLRLLTEPGLAACISANARRKVEQFDWSLVLPQWESILKTIARECGVRSRRELAVSAALSQVLAFSSDLLDSVARMFEGV